jgi:hypothetical protein
MYHHLITPTEMKCLFSSVRKIVSWKLFSSVDRSNYTWLSRVWLHKQCFEGGPRSDNFSDNFGSDTLRQVCEP